MALFIYTMSDNCKMRIKIGDDGATYGIDYYGFYLVKSPSTLGCDVKESNIVSVDFPEMDGDAFYIPSSPSKKSFSYPISLVFFDNSLNSGNKKISDFYNSLLGKKITIFNDYKGVKIVGYVKSYKDGEFYREERDVILFDLEFYVPRPQDCDFNYFEAPVFHGTPQHVVKSAVSKSYTIVVPVGAESVSFSWDYEFGDPDSVIYEELGYNIKDVFEKTTEMKTFDDGSTKLYAVFTYTPSIPFSKQVTYIVK